MTKEMMIVLCFGHVEVGGMTRILLTGGTGFIGRNILPFLSRKYDVLFPTRTELNLIDGDAVLSYVRDHEVEVILHFANPSPAKNHIDRNDRLLADSLRLYFNIKRCAPLVNKIIYLGSGAEYDKRFDIVHAREEDIGRYIPQDDYGFAKYIMNEDARRSTNIYNLRIFGCYGPTDAKTKFIRDAIDCCLENRSITIRQNCFFDYLFVTDLAAVIEYFIDQKPLYHDYNVCSGQAVSLEEIASIVARLMKNDFPIQIMKKGLNKEYTADNTRLLKELKGVFFTPIEQGIAKQIEWQRG